MASPIFQMRLARVERDRWDDAAEDWASLAEFVKEAVEEKIARASHDHLIAPPKPSDARRAVIPEVPGGKVFKGPDPKGGKNK